MMRRLWTPAEDKLLGREYPNCLTAELAARMGCETDRLHDRAARLGIRKSKEWLAGPQSRNLRWNDAGRAKGEAHRFKKGQKPWNAGLKHEPGWSPGRMRETQFKKGNRPQTWVPVGTTRVSKDGYREVKFREREGRHGNWKGVQVLLWEQWHGRVKLEDGRVLKPGAKLPKGYAVVFKDGDKEHIAWDNLELVSRAELMRRNTVHRLPKELAVVIQLAGALKRKLRRLSGEQFDGSAEPTV